MNVRSTNNRGVSAIGISLIVTGAATAFYGASMVLSSKVTQQAANGSVAKRIEQLDSSAMNVSTLLLKTKMISTTESEYTYTPPTNTLGYKVDFRKGKPTYAISADTLTDRWCLGSRMESAVLDPAAPQLQFLFPDPNALSQEQLEKLFAQRELPSADPTTTKVQKIITQLLGEFAPGKTDIRTSGSMTRGQKEATAIIHARVTAAEACHQYSSQEPVAQLFRTLLGREPNRGELTTYAQAVAKGSLHPFDVETQLRSTSEYQSRGGNASEILTTIFRILMSRPPTYPELQKWVAKLGSNPSSDKIQSIARQLQAQGSGQADPALVMELNRMFFATPECSAKNAAISDTLTGLGSGTMTYQSFQQISLPNVPSGAGVDGVGIIALYRTLLAREPIATEISYLATLMSYGKMDPTLSPLEWVSQHLRSLKEFQDLNGCAVPPPPPECRISEAGSTTPKTATLLVYGAANSVTWDGNGIAYSGVPIQISKGVPGGNFVSKATVTGPGGTNECTHTFASMQSCAIYASPGDNGCGPTYSGKDKFQNFEVRIPDAGEYYNDPERVPADTGPIWGWYPIAKDGAAPKTYPNGTPFTIPFPAYAVHWGGFNWGDGGYCVNSNRRQGQYNLPMFTDPAYTKYTPTGKSLVKEIPDAIPYQGNLYQLRTYNSSGGFNWGSTTCKAYPFVGTSPLVIDFEGTGIEITSPDQGAVFALEDPAIKSRYSWVKSKRAYFVTYDKNENGTIDSIDELFGNNTMGPDSAKSKNGFEALKKFDSNGDGRIDQRDAIFEKLFLWQDANGNGISESGELTPIGQMGVTLIDLDYVNEDERHDFYGNYSRQRSVVGLQDGSLRKVYDLWFVKDSSYANEVQE